LANRVKVLIPLPDGPTSGESLWAEQAGEGLYRLLNNPIFAYGYAWGDTVRCVRKEGWWEVLGIARDSQNSTIRIHFSAPPDSPGVRHVLTELGSVGCNYERAMGGLFSVNVPSDVEIPLSQVSNFLDQQPEGVLADWEIGKKSEKHMREWVFAEGT
jgi:hypothetical protein